jgi:hypothetical protein
MDLLQLLDIDLVFIELLKYINNIDVVKLLMVCKTIRFLMLDAYVGPIGRKFSTQIFAPKLVWHWGVITRAICDSAYISFIAPHNLRHDEDRSVKRFLHLIWTCMNDSPAYNGYQLHYLGRYLCTSAVTKTVFENVDWSKWKNHYIMKQILLNLKTNYWANKTWGKMFCRLTLSNVKTVKLRFRHHIRYIETCDFTREFKYE